LNDVAFEAKKQVPKIFKNKFIIRKKTFIKAHTGVKKSLNTFDVNKMSSEMGVIKGKSKSGDNLEQQERGGTILNRDFIPLKSARVGKSEHKLISRRNYLSNIGRNHKRIKGPSSPFKSQKFIKAAFADKTGYIVYNDLLIELRTVKKTRRKKSGKGGKLFIGIEPLYSYATNRVVKVDKAPFIYPAGKGASKKIAKFFKNNAEKRIKRELKI